MWLTPPVQMAADAGAVAEPVPPRVSSLQITANWVGPTAHGWPGARQMSL